MTPKTDTSTFYGAKPKLQTKPITIPLNEPNVLLVDDDLVTVKLLSFALEKRGFHVKITPDGQEALDYLKNSEESHLVLLSMISHNVNGYEILKEIRKNEFSKDTPVIVMTMGAQRKSVDEAFDAGANDYLVKPIQFDDLMIRVKSFTEFN